MKGGDSNILTKVQICINLTCSGATGLLLLRKYLPNFVTRDQLNFHIRPKVYSETSPISFVWNKK